MESDKNTTKSNKDSLLAQETTLVRTQRRVLHAYLECKKAHDEDRLAAKRTLQQEKEDAQNELKIAKDEINKILIDVDSKLQDAKRRNVNYGNDDFTVPVHKNEGQFDKKDIEYYHEVARTAYEEIQAFFNKYYSRARLIETCRNRALWMAFISFIIVGIMTQSFSNGIFISIIAYVIIYYLGKINTEPALRDYFNNLEFGRHGVEVLSKKALEPHELKYQNNLKSSEKRYEQKIKSIDDKWKPQKIEFRRALLDFSSRAEEGFIGTEWDSSKWKEWNTSVRTESCSRIGTFSVGDDMPVIPALTACPINENILFYADGEGKKHAVNAIQSLMIRLFATQPPSKIQFTLIDPVGLGQNVSTFMQLTEHYEKLVGGKVWSEQRHIEQALSNITEHMSNVIQKYLRGQYATIEEYNSKAGEVAEPYRVVVITGFPVKFSNEAATRLLEIAANGQKCGVSTVIMMDSEQQLPFEFNIKDLYRTHTCFEWKDESFTWHDPDYAKLKFIPDTTPSLELFNKLLHGVGKKAKDASKVEVPFARGVLPENEWWKGDSRSGLSVPLGRSGATRLQSLEFGEGTAHHALVIGKTGSGKTSLLHTFITNLALKYSPKELELYLVDFKNVSFTAYVNKLPHVRIVAVQSEPEFGLSVLQGLDVELEHRKRLFSKVGVQNIAQYRNENPDLLLPRVVLIVDEFQEFFTQNDEITQKATQLLDRIVRQGRAFGIHIILGSQTLVGTYNLLRSTIDQMEVRIALQCTEADSLLALAQDNPAARLLSKPGEAIYNASNGLVEGNNRFQGFWLPDEELDKYLLRIQQFSQSHDQDNADPNRQQIVFDGRASAKIEQNTHLKTAIAKPHWTTPQKRVGWIGDPVAIKEPTAIEFHNIAGNNILILGQQEETAQGMFLSILFSLTAQHAPDSVRIIIADFSPSDSPHADLYEKVSQKMPQKIEVVTRRGFLPLLSQINDEVSKRLESDKRDNAPIYIFVFGLQWARDLRSTDEVIDSDHQRERRVPLSKQFSNVLRDGPEIGIHTLIWCDTLANVNRTLEYGLLREFDMRIACQMSETDSLSFVDSPAASKLGQFGNHRAILFNIDKGISEKFLPYSIPEEKWWQDVAVQLKQKNEAPK